ncbi:MAG: SurA N-terminal domain-containing protein [Candidatus Omnitrophota bacterium]
MIFKHLRKFTKTIMWVVAILIVPAFVVWNVGSSIKNRESGYTGELFGKKISQNVYFQEQQATRNNAWLKYGDKFDQVVNLDDQTWTRLMLLHEAKKQGISVSKEEILDYIKNLPVFQYSDFNQENYTMITARIFRQAPVDFEKGVRSSIIINKLMEKLAKDISVSDEEVKKLYDQENEQASASYILVEAKYFQDKVATDNESALKNHYENNKAQFQTPERVIVEYIEVKLEPFKSTVAVSEEQIEQYYNKNRSKYKITDDTETAEQKKEIKYKPLSEVSETIKNMLIEKAMKDKASELIRKILSNLYANSDLYKAAEENGLTAQKTSPFSMTEEVPNVGLNFPFLKAAFSLEIGEISEVIQSTTAYYILKPVKKIKPYIAEYAEVTEEVKNAYKKSVSEKLAQEEAEKLLSSIKELINDKGLSFADAAKQLGLTVKTAENFTRSGYISELGFAQEFTKTAFSLKPQELSGLIITSRGLCILTTNNLKTVNEEQFLKDKTAYQEKVLVKKRNEFLNSWFDELKEKAKLEIYLDKNKGK